MESVLMKEKGLSLYIAGADYNFRQQTQGSKIADDVARALSVMSIQPTEIYSGHQVHGNRICYADGENGDAFIFGRNFPDTDGLLTDKPGIVLLVKYADCTPIVLFDPKRNVVAALHSGWRSTVQRISQKAIKKMVTDFGCNATDIVAFLGPSIDQENYQVGPEVYEAFADFKQRDTFFEAKDNKFQLSMTEANYSLLVEAGLNAENIDVNRISTFLDTRLHSARAEGKEYGLNGLLVMMK